MRMDDRVGPELAEVLDEVEHEAVVVVQDEHPHRDDATDDAAVATNDLAPKLSEPSRSKTRSLLIHCRPVAPPKRKTGGRVTPAGTRSGDRPATPKSTASAARTAPGVGASSR